jgi:hypothetical protein
MHPWRHYGFYGALMTLLFVAGFVFIVGERFVSGNAPDHSAMTWVKVVVGLVFVSILGGAAVACIIAFGDWLKAKTRSAKDEESSA